MISKIIDIWFVSLHLINGTWQIQLVLFLIEALCAIALLIGYHTRLATVLSWVFLISLHSRNPLILQGGDIVSRLLLFWGMFLPLGACWSIDQHLSKKSYSNKCFSCYARFVVANLLYLLVSALLKTDASWRQEGTAAWYALSIEQYSTSFGVYLLNYPNLLKVLTFATLYLEAFGPFFAFSPIYTGPLRFATAVVFICFHLLGLNLIMELGPFSYVCTVAWIAFIPGWFWDKILERQDKAELKWKPSWISNGLASFFIGYIFLYNVSMLEIAMPPYSAIGIP